MRQFVNIFEYSLHFFLSLASRTRIDAVELIVRKYFLLWWSVCVLEVTFYSLI